MVAILPRRRRWSALYWHPRDDVSLQWLTMTAGEARRDFWRRVQRWTIGRLVSWR